MIFSKRKLHNEKSPVAFFIFNRPALTELVFNSIKKYKPEILLIIADGARDEEESDIVNQTRCVVDLIDWECKVFKNYSIT